MPNTEGQIVTPAALRQLKEAGYELVHSEFGPMASGKTTRANKKAESLKESGHDVRVFDGLWRNFQGGVEIYARKGRA